MKDGKSKDESRSQKEKVPAPYDSGQWRAIHKVIWQIYIDVIPYNCTMSGVRFEWDTEKEQANVTKHGVDFTEATAAFHDPRHLISADEGHSSEETRLFCIGRTARGILMVRFTYRGDTIRIIGAGLAERQETL